MLARFPDLGRQTSLFDELRAQMERLTHDHTLAALHARQLGASFAHDDGPRFELRDEGEALIFQADVPGMTEQDLTVAFEGGVLTVSGTRKLAAPEGYEAERRERGVARFTRTLRLPVRIDPEKVTATMKDGVLTVSLAKAADARPRQIAIQTA